MRNSGTIAVGLPARVVREGKRDQLVASRWTTSAGAELEGVSSYRLINTSHQVAINGPSYRPNRRPKPDTAPNTKEAIGSNINTGIHTCGIT